MNTNAKPKLVRITTVPVSMNIILRNQLRFMNRYFDVVGVTGYHEKHFNEVKEREGIRMHRVEMARNIAPLKDLVALVKLWSFFIKEKPQIVHTHTPKAGFLGMTAAWLAGVPVRLHTVAGLPLTETSGIKKKLLSLIEKITYRFADKVYPNSLGLNKIIVENRFCAVNKLKVIGNGSSNGIDTDNYNPDHFTKEFKIEFKQRLGINRNDFVFCFIGRIAREKGTKELVDAFLRLKKENIVGGTQWDGIKLVFVGLFEKEYGALDLPTQDIINTHSDIKFVGRHDDIRPYLVTSDVFVLPTYREGFPNVVLQAGSMGLPSIVTDINGCNEIVVNNQNGIIIQSKDSNALYDAMKKLLVDDALRNTLAGNARKMIVDRYKQDVILQELLSEYQTQIANNV